MRGGRRLVVALGVAALVACSDEVIDLGGRPATTAPPPGEDAGRAPPASTIDGGHPDSDAGMGSTARDAASDDDGGGELPLDASAGGATADAASGRSDVPPEGGCMAHDFGAHRYWFCDTHRSAADAERACADAGGHLVSIGDADEQAFVVGIVGDDEWLIGARQQGGEWRWSDGTSVAYTAWADGEPGDEACSKLDEGRWLSVPCSDGESYVCEVP